jgi:hypothetical protein
MAPENVDMIRLTDISGFAIIEQADINRTDFSLDISKVKPGYYILEIISGKVLETIRVEKK